MQVWADDLRAEAPQLTPFEARTLIGGVIGSSIAAAWHGADTDHGNVLILVRKALDAALN